MNVSVNGEVRELADRLSLADLIGGAPASCAVAVNGAVVPRSAHGETTLEEGDVVEIVTAVAGG